MSLDKISADDIKTQIHNIFKSHDYNRKGRIDILDEISDLGKELIGNLNSADKTIYEIQGEMDDVIEEYDKIMQEIDKARDEFTDSNTSIEQIDARIEELETKGEENLTDSEKRELEWLRGQRENYQATAENASGQVDSLTGTSQSTIAKLDGFNEQLGDIADATEEYHAAGEQIQSSAKQYGREAVINGDDLRKQRTSWFNFFSIGNGNGSKYDKYVKASGYEMVGDTVNNTQYTYYDGVEHEFVAEYDVMEQKGGNKIQGALRKSTAKAWSYGQTIQDASNIVNEKAEETKKKEDEEK